MSQPSGQIAKVNDIEIWHETFGKENDPALLLIMGALSQGIQWPTEFCEQLANSGFYVIRYDQRDTGQSICFDFEKNPYDLLDLLLSSKCMPPKRHALFFNLGD